MPQPSTTRQFVGRARGGLGERRVRLGEAAHLLQRHRQVVQHRRLPAAVLGGVAQRVHPVAPPPLAQRHQAEVEVRLRSAGRRSSTRRNSRAGLVEHRRLVEREPEVAVLLDPRVAARPAATSACVFPSRCAKPGGDEPVQRLADVELEQAGVVDQPRHVALAVQQRQEPLLLGGERDAGGRQPRAVHHEDQVEGRDLLLDEAPLVHPARALRGAATSGVMRTRKSCASGATSGSKLKVPDIQVKR